MYDFGLRIADCGMNTKVKGLGLKAKGSRLEAKIQKTKQVLRCGGFPARLRLRLRGRRLKG